MASNRRRLVELLRKYFLEQDPNRSDVLELELCGFLRRLILREARDGRRIFPKFEDHNRRLLKVQNKKNFNKISTKIAKNYYNLDFPLF